MSRIILQNQNFISAQLVEWSTWQKDWMTRWTMVGRRLNEMDYGLKKIEWQDGLWFEKNEWNYDWGRGKLGWMIMSWWNLKSMLEQRDDQNLTLQSIFYLGYQWWLSKVICLTLASTLNGNFYYHPFMFRHKTGTLTSDWGITHYVMSMLQYPKTFSRTCYTSTIFSSNTAPNSITNINFYINFSSWEFAYSEDYNVSFVRLRCHISYH